MRYAVDASLGKLGRLLRSAGFDTVCQHECPHHRFWDMLASDRLILTRTGSILRRFQSRRPVFITDNDPWRQLGQVAAEHGLCMQDIHPFTRCMVCNAAIAGIDRETVWGRVPPYVWHHFSAFSQCPCCKRIYWAGSHHERVRRRIELIFQYEERQTHA